MQLRSKAVLLLLLPSLLPLLLLPPSLLLLPLQLLLVSFSCGILSALHLACICMSLRYTAALQLPALLLVLQQQPPPLLLLPSLLPPLLLSLLQPAVPAEPHQQLHLASIRVQLRSKAVLPLPGLLLCSTFETA
jgi:hypothetical protein